MDKVAVEIGANTGRRPRGARPKVAVPPGTVSQSPEERQKKLVNEFQALVGRLVKTEAGRVLLTTGPGADLDKLMGDLSADETIRARRLLVLRDQFGVLAPKAQKELDRLEKARLQFHDRELNYNAGRISQNEFNAAKLEVTQAERALKTVEDAMAAIIADVKKLADELRPRPRTRRSPTRSSPRSRKVMAEFDAIALRLAKNPVGRLLATIPSGRDLGRIRPTRRLRFGNRRRSIKARRAPHVSRPDLDPGRHARRRPSAMRT